MTKKSLLEQSIDQRLAQERHLPPQPRKARKRLNISLLLAVSILISLVITLLKLLAFF